MGLLLQRAGLCRLFGFAALFLIFFLGTYSPSKSSSANTWSLLRETLYSLCELDGPEQLPILNNSVQSAHGVSEFSVSPNDDGWDAEILTEEGFLSVQKFSLRGGPERLILEFFGGATARPEWLVVVGAGCNVRTARRLDYDGRGVLQRLHYLDGKLMEIRITDELNPLVPDGTMRDGVRVAVVDSGVNYLLSEINARLGRDANGRVRGYDFWDLDEQPFDYIPIPSPFYPSHHGTKIMSVIIQSSSEIVVLPYRYPRFNMSRMAPLIGHISDNKARIVNVSLASNDRDAWSAFGQSIKMYPDILFVVAAGNDDRNIDRVPIYPASFGFDNIIVATGGTSEGYLAPGANWGMKAVDFLVSSERVRVLDFDGRKKWVGGSSYAAARVSGLAACILAKNPKLDVGSLRQELFSRAERINDGHLVRHGFLKEAEFSGGNNCGRGLETNRSLRQLGN